MIRAITIAFLSCIVTIHFCKQIMATRNAISALHSVVYVTVPNITVAKEIARAVVSGKLAACVNIIPSVTSIYEWQGKLEEESELLLIVKTKTSALEKLKEKVVSLHPYDVPEFIAAPITSGSESYLNWIDKQVV